MSFLRGVAPLGRGRDAALKQALLNNLSECVKDIQYDSQFEGKVSSALGAGDSSSALCGALEALLLHGLKDSLMRRARNALADPDRRPQPDFWPLVLVVSHRQSVEQISTMPQIVSAVGMCRAWLRAALNDCLLSSYLATLQRDTSAVFPFYERWALARDSDALELARRLCEGLESCVQFELPVNSSLLNSWPESVLVLAGARPPSTRLAPVTAGLDIASTLASAAPLTPTPTPPVAVAATTLPAGLGRMLALDEDEALNFILSEPTRDDIENKDMQEPEKLKEMPEHGSEREPSPSVPPSPPLSPSPPLPPSPPMLSTPSPHGSSLVPTPELSSSPAEPSTDLRDMMRDIHAELALAGDNRGHVHRSSTPPLPAPRASAAPDDPALQLLGFEVVPGGGGVDLGLEGDTEEVRRMVRQLGSLSRERGLDAQNYRCAGCRDPLGGGGAARSCAFSGEYYCAACMSRDAYAIPARIVHNWDFKRYPVSEKAAQFLSEFQQRPWMDMRELNPRIYAGVADMARVRELRVQLNLLRAYVWTCREASVREELRRRVWPREYLYESVHAYAPADLAQVPTGSLAAQLERVAAAARAHVPACALCSQKGFICEVCRDPRPIFPFDTSDTFRCEQCAGVFHATCLHARAPCPRCRRRRERDERHLR